MNGPVELGEAFDPKADLSISEHYRPHWSQAGAIVFITFRTADSIPREVLTRWEREKQAWVDRLDIDKVSMGDEPHGELLPSILRPQCSLGENQHWSKVIQTLDSKLQRQFKKHFNRCREISLDSCMGECVLRRPELAQIVADALLFFDGQRYRMGDFVVMPNHVHLLVAFASEDALVTQCDSWLHYSARQINLALGRKGKFWQQEPFDHLVRSGDQYGYLRNYIRENPKKARLKEGAFLYRRYE